MKHLVSGKLSSTCTNSTTLLYFFLSFYVLEFPQCFSQNNLGKTYFLNCFWLTSTEMGYETFP